MRNHHSREIIRHRALIAALCAALVQLITGCGSISPKPNHLPAVAGRDFSTDLPEKTPVFATRAEIERTKNESAPYQYRIGPGDIIGIKVWLRPELSQERLIVAPDGTITVPRVGMVPVSGKTPEEVRQAVTEKLSVLYIKPEVTVQVADVQNNKAFVLGRVNSPGIVRFAGRGTLLEGLALAGGLPKEDTMSRCSIIRGNSSVIWIDLQDLLRNGNMSLNAHIMNNDIIYVPEHNDELVYIMGEVKAPGAIRMQGGMNVLKAVMLAGGMNGSGDPEKVFIIRQQDAKGTVVPVNMKNLIARGDFSQNYNLMPNDIVYVSPTGMAKFNYTLENLMPALQFINLGTAAASSSSNVFIQAK